MTKNHKTGSIFLSKKFTEVNLPEIVQSVLPVQKVFVPGTCVPKLKIPRVSQRFSSHGIWAPMPKIPGLSRKSLPHGIWVPKPKIPGLPRRSWSHGIWVPMPKIPGLSQRSWSHGIRVPNPKTLGLFQRFLEFLEISWLHSFLSKSASKSLLSQNLYYVHNRCLLG